MSRQRASLSAEYFDSLYAAKQDPWNFAASAYEKAKYDRTLAALPREHYRHGLEVGCSIGVLTARLAQRCDRLVAVDVADQALDQARARCRECPNVMFLKHQVPTDWPQGRFDLVLLSEVVYYLDAADVRRLAQRVNTSLEPGGTVLLVHWTGTTEYPLSGDEAAELFIEAAAPRLHAIQKDRTADYRLDCLAPA
jgi:cyclopropane fatty-acyl-phospholipid synthase-like methyltransferase